MKKIFTLFSAVVLAVCLFLLSACGEIAVTSVTLDQTSITLVEGENKTLAATVSPDDATDKTVSWSSSNESVATVSDGKVTAVSAGSATVTATAGGKSAACAVTVTAQPTVEETQDNVENANNDKNNLPTEMTEEFLKSVIDASVASNHYSLEAKAVSGNYVAEVLAEFSASETTAKAYTKSTNINGEDESTYANYYELSDDVLTQYSCSLRPDLSWLEDYWDTDTQDSTVEEFKNYMASDIFTPLVGSWWAAADATVEDEEDLVALADLYESFRYDASASVYRATLLFYGTLAEAEVELKIESGKVTGLFFTGSMATVDQESGETLGTQEYTYSLSYDYKSENQEELDCFAAARSLYAALHKQAESVTVTVTVTDLEDETTSSYTYKYQTTEDGATIWSDGGNYFTSLGETYLEIYESQDAEAVYGTEYNLNLYEDNTYVNSSNYIYNGSYGRFPYEFSPTVWNVFIMEVGYYYEFSTYNLDPDYKMASYFTEGENNTYTATLNASDVYTESRFYGTITVVLTDDGSLASVTIVNNYNATSVSYVFSDYGNTTVTVPDWVIESSANGNAD